MAQMKEQIKVLEKIQLSNKEIANISDGECKALVIKMLTELIELGRKMKEQVKDAQSEIKQNIQYIQYSDIQGTNCEGKETGTQINNLEQKEEINIQLEQNEERRNKKK